MTAIYNLSPRQAGPVPSTGWRLWEVQRRPELYDSHGFLDVLVSPLAPDVWLSREMTARCAHKGNHKPPKPECGCGLDSVPSLWAFTEYLLATCDDWPRPELRSLVLGRVQLHGQVAYSQNVTDPPDTTLAERMTITGPLYLSPGANGATATLLARAYGVEVVRPSREVREWMPWLLAINVSRSVGAPPQPGAWLLDDVFGAMREVGMDV